MDDAFIFSTSGRDNLPTDSNFYTDFSNTSTIPIGWWDMGIVADLLTELFTITDIENSNNRSLDARWALSKSKNISYTISTLDESITSFIRTGPNEATVWSTAYSFETYIIVQWTWITLPGLFVALSIAFFAMTILYSSRRKSPLWRSKITPLLFCRLSGWKDAQLGVQNETDIDEVARSLNAQLLEVADKSRRFVKDGKLI